MNPSDSVSRVELQRLVRRGRGFAGAQRWRLDPRPRALPDFLILGAQKAGTTSLYSQLVAHPSVLPATKKEVHYFDRRRRAEGWYRAHFPSRAELALVAERTGRSLTGEASPYYLFHPAVPQRVRRTVPDARLIAVLRDPVERAISGYHHQVRHGHEHRPIELALDPRHAVVTAPETDDRWYDAPGPARRLTYLARGHYAEQLERWFSCFAREQVLVLESTALRAGSLPAAVLSFLGLPRDAVPAVADQNVGSYARPASAVERMLRDYYRPHNERLFSLLGVTWDWPVER
jgi:hypothetical protein